VEFSRSVCRLALEGLKLGLCLFLTGWKRILDMLNKSEFEFLLLLAGLVL
jgi:hypothetical protein